MNALPLPSLDPSPIFELFRGSYATDLLTAAVAHFNIFDRLADVPLTFGELQSSLQLDERPTVVLTTALRAMGLLVRQEDERFALTPLAREHLIRNASFDVGNYLSLAASSPSVMHMVERLRSNRPAGLNEHDSGAAFIYRDGIKSAMDQSELAEHFTLALSGRARNVAPVLASAVPLPRTRILLDVGGGTGLYSIAYLRAHPELQAIVFDRPEVLRIAARFMDEFAVSDRVQLVAGDMFSDSLPSADAVLLSNILHDWDIPECKKLVQRCAGSLNHGGQLIIHDVLLNDALDGPLPIALYSAALFTLTEGRAYSAGEYNGWLQEAGLHPQSPVPTLVHGHAIVARRTIQPETV